MNRIIKRKLIDVNIGEIIFILLFSYIDISQKIGNKINLYNLIVNSFLFDISNLMIILKCYIVLIYFSYILMDIITFSLFKY